MKKNVWHPFSELEGEWLKDPEFKKEFDALEPEYALVREVMDKRLAKKMTQKELAKKVGTKQSAISRLESGSANPSFRFLQKVASASDSKLTISFQ